MTKREAKDYIRRLSREIGLEQEKRGKVKFYQELVMRDEKAGKELSYEALVIKRDSQKILKVIQSNIDKYQKRIFEIIDEIRL